MTRRRRGNDGKKVRGMMGEKLTKGCEDEGKGLCKERGGPSTSLRTNGGGGVEGLVGGVWTLGC